MKCISRLITLLASLAGWGCQIFGAPPHCLVISSDRIRLQDLAPSLPQGAMDVPDRQVGFAPRPGMRRVLSFREWARASRQRLPDEPEELCVERQARQLTMEIVTLALQSAYKDWGSPLEIQVLELPKTLVPEGALVFPASRVRMARPDPRTGIVHLTGYIAYGDDPNRPLRFPIWVRARVEGPVARVELTCPLEAGAELRSDCLRTATVRGYPVRDDQEEIRAETLTGRKARRKLAEGTILRAAYFAAKHDVEPNQEIQLTVRSGRATLQLTATSEGGAAKGGWVLLRLRGVRQRLRAHVVAAGEAEYVLPSARSTPPVLLEAGARGSKGDQ